MKTSTVILVFVASVLLLLALGILLSFFFLQIKPDFSFFLGEQIALIELKGDISNDEGLFSASATAEEIAEQIKKAEKDPAVKGILLEINSGGGSAVATKQIVRALRDSNKHKVAWISDIGASGAYYSAAACDYIIADEDSLTGSLGVISILLNLSSLEEKHGIGAETFSKGIHKDMGNPFTELDGEERRIMEEIIDQTYQNFRNGILELRKGKIKPVHLDEVFDGRIMSGKQALGYGLIDATGSKDDAIKKLSEMTGIKEPTIIKYTPQRSLLSYLTSMGYSFGEGFKQSLASEEIKLRS